jgi:hypothetical protein
MPTRPGFIPADGSYRLEFAVAANSLGSMQLLGVGAKEQTISGTYEIAPDQWAKWESFDDERKVQSVYLARQKDGRLQLFAIDEKRRAITAYQTKAGGNGREGWKMWSKTLWSRNFGIASVTLEELQRIAVGMNQDGRLELFGIGELDLESIVHRHDDVAKGYHEWQNKPSSGWSDLHELSGQEVGFTSDSIAVGSNQDGRLEIFTIKGDGSVWHTWQKKPNGGWSPWVPFTGPRKMKGVPAVGLDASGYLSLFVRGQDEELWHIHQVEVNGGWSDWTSLGALGKSNGPVGRHVVGRGFTGNLCVFAQLPDQSLSMRRELGVPDVWSPWRRIESTYASLFPGGVYSFQAYPSFQSPTYDWPGGDDLYLYISTGTGIVYTNEF